MSSPSPYAAQMGEGQFTNYLQNKQRLAEDMLYAQHDLASLSRIYQIKHQQDDSENLVLLLL